VENSLKHFEGFFNGPLKVLRWVVGGFVYYYFLF